MTVCNYYKIATRIDNKLKGFRVTQSFSSFVTLTDVSSTGVVLPTLVG